MYLSTLTFTVLVMPVLLFLFYCIPGKAKNVFMLCSGLLIYSWGSPMRILIPMACLCFHYGIGLAMEKLRKRKGWSALLLGIAAALQTGALFAARLIPAIEAKGFFPIGIAVLTLQGIGYLIGIYRKKYSAETNFLNFALYLLFFPTLYTGPLMSYQEFSEQLRNRKCNILNLGAGLALFIRGLAEKAVLADTLGYVFQELRQAEPSDMSMLTAWLTVISFSMYLYFELLGYADMARGLGKCFGMNLPKNFGHPFFTPSITSFMENWNISQVLWFQTNFRHFLFRNNKRRWVKYISLVLMWMLIGLWYGTSVQFLLWGMIIGLLLAMEQLFLGNILKRNYAFGLLYTSICIQFVWVFFFAESMKEVLQYWKSMIGFGSGLIDQYGIYFFTSYVVFLLICFYIATDLFRNITERISATAVGRKINSLMPLIECVVLIFCFACMLYTKTTEGLWLQL